MSGAADRDCPFGGGEEVLTVTQRRRFASMLGVAVVTLAACSPSATPSPSVSGGVVETPSGAPVARVTLRLAASTQGGGYPTPYAAIRGPGRLMTSFMFDTLAYPDVTGEPKPWLATSWDTSPDGKTWTFHLNPAATFTDGQPLTADDVVFSFNYDLTGPGADTGAVTGLNYIDTVTAADSATVVVTLKSVHPSFLTDITGPFGIAVMPKHIWESVTDPAHFQGDQAVIGSGPYTLQQFDQTTNSFDLVANDNFYLGKPVVQEIQIIPVGDPLLALQQGDVAAASTGNSAIPQSQFDQLSQQFTLLTARGEFNEALFFNLGAGFPYDNVSFRQGIAYALDRQDMLTRLASGRGVPGSAGGLGPANPFLDSKLPDYAFDLTKAGSLLDVAGLKDANGDGVRDLPDGSPFAITLLSSSSDNAQAQLVQQYLKAAGLTVDITAVDQPTSDARDAAGDYQMAIVHFGGLSGDPSGLVNRFASTSKSKSFTRVSGYANDQFDQLATQQSTTLDVAARKDLVDKMQEILATDLPQLSLYVPDQVSFVDAKVYNGWGYTPGCPPCGVSLNKRMLVSGSADPVP
jgi:peptide/nickel transport system substrate-binding protein